MKRHTITASESYGRARKKLGLNHHEMGKLLGIAHTTSVRWEAGDRQPPALVTAVMVAIQRGAMSVDVLESWMAAAARAVDG